MFIVFNIKKQKSTKDCIPYALILIYQCIGRTLLIAHFGEFHELSSFETKLYNHNKNMPKYERGRLRRPQPFLICANYDKLYPYGSLLQLRYP